MANYRAVVRHVRYWRGVPHVWSTVYPYIGTLTRALTVADAQTVLTNDAKMCYGPATATGGAFQCEIYNQSSGGVPVVTYTAFDHTNPSAWTGYPASVVTGATGITVEAEVAALVEWPAGLSRTGKPVKLRKWYHAVPLSLSTTGGSADLSSTNVTALNTQAAVITGQLGGAGLALGSYRGVFAGTPVTSAFFSNHQMPRGRRRKPLVTADGRYTGPTVTIGPPEED